MSQQVQLDNYAIPVSEEEIDEEGNLANPSVVAECTECHSILKRMGPFTVEETDDGRRGRWQFSCRTSWCGGNRTAGAGAVTVRMEAGEIADVSTRNAETKDKSLVKTRIDGQPIINPDDYVAAKQEMAEDPDE